MFYLSSNCLTPGLNLLLHRMKVWFYNLRKLPVRWKSLIMNIRAKNWWTTVRNSPLFFSKDPLPSDVFGCTLPQLKSNVVSLKQMFLFDFCRVNKNKIVIIYLENNRVLRGGNTLLRHVANLMEEVWIHSTYFWEERPLDFLFIF